MYSEGKKGYIQSNACRQNKIIKHPNWTYQSTVTPLNSNWELFGCYIWDSFQCTYWGHYNNSVFVVFMHVCTTPIHTMFVAVVCLFQNRQCEQNMWLMCVCVNSKSYQSTSWQIQALLLVSYAIHFIEMNSWHFVSKACLVSSFQYKYHINYLTAGQNCTIIWRRLLFYQQYSIIATAVMSTHHLVAVFVIVVLLAPTI